MVDSLFSFQDAATDYGDLANELLTTVLDGCGSRWTLTTAHTSDDEVRRTALDPPGSAKPPEKRKVGGSTPPLTTSVSPADFGRCLYHRHRVASAIDGVTPLWP